MFRFMNIGDVFWRNCFYEKFWLTHRNTYLNDVSDELVIKK